MLQKRLPEIAITEGYYDLLRDDDLIGHEHFHIHPLALGFILKGEIEITWPRVHSITYEFQVTKAWEPVTLRTSLEAGDVVRRGSLRQEAGEWITAVRDTDGDTTRERFPLPGAGIDFGSPVFPMASILRHRPVPGEPKELDVAFMELPTLTASPNRHRLAATTEEASGGDSLEWKGRKYTLTDLGGAAPVSLLVHRSGIVLEQTTKLAGAVHKTLLTEWDREFDWPMLW